MKDNSIPSITGEVINYEDVINSIARQEVLRLQRNLGALDSLESMLISNIKEQLEMVGRVDNETLMDVIKTFNKSVERSNNIISGKAGDNLLNVLTEIRMDQEEDQIEIQKEEEAEQFQIDSNGRKRIRSLLSAIIDEDSMVDINKEELDNE